MISKKSYKTPQVKYLNKIGEGAEKIVYDLGEYVLKIYTQVWRFTDSLESLLEYWKLYKDNIYKQLSDYVLEEELIYYYIKKISVGDEYFPISVQKKVQEFGTYLEDISIKDLNVRNLGIKDNKLYIIDYFTECPKIRHKIL